MPRPENKNRLCSASARPGRAQETATPLPRTAPSPRSRPRAHPGCTANSVVFTAALTMRHSVEAMALFSEMRGRTGTRAHQVCRPCAAGRQRGTCLFRDCACDCGTPDARLIRVWSRQRPCAATADFVIVAVADTVPNIINRTSLALMKDSAVLIPLVLDPNNVVWDELYASLEASQIGGAVLDVWPDGAWCSALSREPGSAQNGGAIVPFLTCSYFKARLTDVRALVLTRVRTLFLSRCTLHRTAGCWGYKLECGPPFGPSNGTDSFRDQRPRMTPNVMFQTKQFWDNSAAFVGANPRPLWRAGRSTWLTLCETSPWQPRSDERRRPHSRHNTLKPRVQDRPCLCRSPPQTQKFGHTRHFCWEAD